MKKIITLLAVVGLLSLQSCTVNDNTPVDYVDHDTISEVFEVTTSFNSTNNYSKIINLNPAIFASDVVLVYRLSGVYNGSDLWKLMPETFYFDNGTLDFGYRFDFSRYDINVYMVGNNLQSVSTAFRNNQVLRVVIVPGSFSKSINLNNYNEVIAALNVKEKDIQKIDF
ncbi:hypothetical protein SLW70_07330 [Flavobacterium sp. NG2]|uniref:hypothetical protein n=1 Tax=Flavobacterium sp. NG2 TaxID=3097547 RepID=UPI002A81F0AA|nr:hypothetical protein [Flavobacterium sp. NG2]WPR72923.1 hypothetical protein SLW70_07330 [Flavobacterium sp. NG2]